MMQSNPVFKGAVVVGCGVIGLTTAISLQNEGFEVVIFAEHLPPNTTSNIAAALWFPFQAAPYDKVLEWSKKSLIVFQEQFNDQKSGISFRNFKEYFVDQKIEPPWAKAVDSFIRVDEHSLPNGYSCGFSTRVAIVQTDIYLNYLIDKFILSGGKIIQKKINHFNEIHSNYKIIFNCSGLGSMELALDKTVYPIRGQIVSVVAPEVTECSTADEGPLAISYIIKREHDVILGGTVEPHESDLTPRSNITQQIILKCRILDAKIEENVVINQVKVGLRPGRPAIRLEKEILTDGRMVIHNYGHGGSGITVSWGCAQEVIEILYSRI